MSNSKDKLVPEIRFKGFADAWEQRRLGEVSTKVTEKNKNNVFDETLTNSAEHGIINQRVFFDKDISNKKNLKDYFIVEPNDFVYNPRISNFAPVGPIKRNLLGRTGIMSPLYYVFRIVEGDLSFVEKYFESVYWHYFLIINGDNGVRSDRFNIKDSVFEELLIPFPGIAEQTSVGNFFRTLDDTIAIQKHKLDKLKELKKGYLQLMFPQPGQDIPQVRFAGFSEPWELRKLGEMGSTFTGLSGKTKEDFGHGDARFVTYMNVFTNPVAIADGTESVEIDSRQSEVKFGDIFFTTSSETPEEVGMASVWLENTVNVYLNSFCFGYRPVEKFAPYYLAFMLRSPAIRKKFEILAQGISRYNISKNKVMEMTVPIPKLDEQNCVGNFFRSLDEQITAEQVKLDKLKQLKSAYLQKMFV